jgi:hypothetical protein
MKQAKVLSLRFIGKKHIPGRWSRNANVKLLKDVLGLEINKEAVKHGIS